MNLSFRPLDADGDIAARCPYRCPSVSAFLRHHWGQMLKEIRARADLKPE